MERPRRYVEGQITETSIEESPIKNRTIHYGYTLVEVVVVVMIAAAIMVAVLTVYTRAQATASSINARLDSQMLPNEIAQRIAQDIDKLTSPGLETAIAIANKVDAGFELFQLSITTHFYGKGTQPKKHLFEEVIWQTDYDPDTDSIVLYRLHAGVNFEDKLVDKHLLDKAPSERELFVPITTGMTFFQILAGNGETEYPFWRQTTLPKALRLKISFAQPVEDMDGNLVIAEEDKTIRTVAIDRTRKLRYKFVRQEFEIEEPDPNDLSDDDTTEEDPESEGAGTVPKEGEGEGGPTEATPDEKAITGRNRE